MRKARRKRPRYFTLSEWIASNTELDEETGCLNWIRSFSAKYGVITFRGGAHRAAWIVERGEIPVEEAVPSAEDLCQLEAETRDEHLEGESY